MSLHVDLAVIKVDIDQVVELGLQLPRLLCVLRLLPIVGHTVADDQIEILTKLHTNNKLYKYIDKLDSIYLFLYHFWSLVDAFIHFGSHIGQTHGLCDDVIVVSSSLPVNWVDELLSSWMLFDLLEHCGPQKHNSNPSSSILWGLPCCTRNYTHVLILEGWF